MSNARMVLKLVSRRRSHSIVMGRLSTGKAELAERSGTYEYSQYEVVTTA